MRVSMPFDPRAWIRPSWSRWLWIRRSWIRRLGAACCGGALVFAVCLAPVPAAAQFLHASSQTSVKVGCPAAGCDCYDNGVLTACPVDHEYFFDNVSPAAPIHDLHTADVIGRYQTLDGETRSQATANVQAGFGVLRGSLSSHGYASGTYIEAGGLAVPCEAKVDASVSFQDMLQLTGAVPLGPVSIRISQDIGSTDFELMRGSDNYPISNFCLANGDATTSIDAQLTTTHLGMMGGGDQSVGYLRKTNEYGCYPPTVTGDRHAQIEIDGNDGDMVIVSETVNLQSYILVGGGTGVPNRVILADSNINAFNTARVIVEVLTPGASYTSMSGTVYQLPESGGGAGPLAADAALLVLLVLRRSVGPRTRHS